MNNLVQEARALSRAALNGPWVALCGKSAAAGEMMIRCTSLLPEMAAEIERLESKAQFQTEAYDRNAKIHEALTRDYLALKSERDRFKARAEAAEADMKRIADDIYGETDACYPCAICAKNNSRCDTGDTCFEWRGPQEGANP